MTVARITQQYIEVAATVDNRNARVTQMYIECACLRTGWSHKIMGIGLPTKINSVGTYSRINGLCIVTGKQIGRAHV